MASLWKHPQSRYWTACFTDAAGKQRKRSTKTTDRRLAMKIAESYEEATRRRRTVKQVRDTIAQLHSEITGENVPEITTSTFVKDWLARKKPETAPSTLAFYTKASDKFLVFLGQEAQLEITQITREHIIRFRNEETKTLAPKTVNHDLKCLRMIFKAARRDGMVTEDPTEFVETVRQARENKRRPFTIAELQAVLAVADAEWKSMILFGFYTGQRLSDIAMLTWSSIDIDRREIQLITRKTDRSMILPMAEPLRLHLRNVAKGVNPEMPLHPSAHRTLIREGKSSSLSNQFAELLCQIGLRTKASHKSTGKGRTAKRESHALSFHCLRHTATTLMHDAGVPAAAAQEMIGHDSAEIHRLYVNVGRAALNQAVAALPNILGI